MATEGSTVLDCTTGYSFLSRQTRRCKWVAADFSRSLADESSSPSPASSSSSSGAVSAAFAGSTGLSRGFCAPFKPFGERSGSAGWRGSAGGSDEEGRGRSVIDGKEGSPRGLTDGILARVGDGTPCGAGDCWVAVFCSAGRMAVFCSLCGAG